MLDGLFHTITGCHWRWNMQMTRTIDLRKTPPEDLLLLLIISMTKTYLWANVRQHLTNIYVWLKAKQNLPTHLYMTHMKLRLYYHCKLFHLQCRTQQCMTYCFVHHGKQYPESVIVIEDRISTSCDRQVWNENDNAGGGGGQSGRVWHPQKAGAVLPSVPDKDWRQIIRWIWCRLRQCITYNMYYGTLL